MPADREKGSRLRFSDDENADAAPVQPNKQEKPKRKPDVPEKSTVTENRSSSGASVADTGNAPAFTRSRLRFTEDEITCPAQQKAEQQAEKATEKLDKAKARIPKKKAMSIARETDEATGKVKTRLRFDEKAKPAPSAHSSEITRLPLSELHRQIGKVEDENVGVEAAHHGEETAESAERLASHSYRAHKLKPYRAMEKAEQRLDKANIRVLQAKEPLSSNPYSRWRQKQAIRKAYAAAKAAGGSPVANANVLRRAVHGIKHIFVRRKKTYILGGALFLLMAMVMNGLSSCTPLVQGGLQAFVIATYPAEDADILAAERYYKGLENELRSQIDHYAADHPQYDEFVYEPDEIWHDPHALISLVSAHANGEWKIDGVCSFMDRLFQKQYTLTQSVKSETRYREEWVTHYEKIVDPETGEITWRPYQRLEDVPYTYRVCTVTLDNFNLSHLPFYVLSGEGVGRYAMYISVLGNREDLFRGNPYASTLREPGEYDIPEEYLEDETFARLLEEAEKYIGYPYVWGGDSPETSFDCSGFVSYVFANSGVRDVGRLGATSLYGRCQKISAAEAKPGDLIFFEKTIPGEDGITHVGIYVGDGYMLHCGNPIGYADLSESYWQNHYFGYGRLARD
ncbi:MAG: NlpC/P60 family protein [Eubacteriales bacterium]|nr:NlpC/P60 family protein [Eubacteriales bacterium]